MDRLTINDLPIGTEIYNHGDMANLAHFGKIISHPTAWYVEILTEENKRYMVPVALYTSEYKGNGSTRLVTKEAYNKFRKEQLNLFYNKINKKRNN